MEHETPFAATTCWEQLKICRNTPIDRKLLGITLCGYIKCLVLAVILNGVFAMLLFGSLRKMMCSPAKTVLILENPILEVQPLNENNEAYIVYQPDKEDSVKKWVKKLENFLQPYHHQENATTCNYQSVTSSNKTICKVPWKLGNCIKEENYGYNSFSPCIFLTLKKLLGWKPKCYNYITNQMPLDLIRRVNTTPAIQRDQIWVNCYTKKEEDRGNYYNLIYMPKAGFPAYFYPYLGAKGYLEPLIAIQINNLIPNMKTTIECQSYARNIIHDDPVYISGKVQFTIVMR